MKNISFDNPFLLLLIIPLFAVILVPYFIAIRKENKSKSSTIALICHLVMVVLSVLAIAGMKHTTIMTKTEIYVLADVSNSTSHKTELIDGYIKELEDDLKGNTELAVITFAKDAKLHTELGEDFETVKDSGVDDSATDIVAALDYAATLFRDDTIKRIVLYTDGMSTDPNANSGLIRSLENLHDSGVYIDIVYIDSNLSEGEVEIQVSDVEYNASTYKGHETNVSALIESTVEAGVIVRLNKNGVPFREQTANLSVGYNTVSFRLDTAEAGEFEYSVTIHSQSDSSTYNNDLGFIQTVNENISVLLISDTKDDIESVKAIYGENAVITSFIKPVAPPPSGWGNDPKPPAFDVPMTVEELCKYDEYVISNVKLDEINNSESFVEALDICVSMFGKSLITAGNNYLHNSETAAVDKLNSMLPVKFGNSDSDPKLYTIMMDFSRSMEFKNFDYFRMAKLASKYLLDFLDEGDYFAFGYFAGETYMAITPTKVTPENIDAAKLLIDSLEVEQGTMIGRALDNAYDMLKEYEIFDDKQLMLISDGMSFEGGEVYADDPIGSARKLQNIGVTVSTLNAGNPEGVTMMQNIAAAGGGKYYFTRTSDELPGVMFDEVKDDVTDTLIEAESEVIVNRPNDSVLAGVGVLPKVSTYMYARSKPSAENVLFVKYKKSGGEETDVPLYAYWNYGNGRVSTLTTSFGGSWVANWNDEESRLFLSNIAKTNTPKEKIDYPYTVETLFDGKNIHLDIVPAVINPDATMTVTVTRPDGTSVTEKLVFDSYRYFYSFEAGSVGKYKITTDYNLSTVSYTSENVFNIPYSPEYNSFATFSPAPLHSVIRDNGTVTDNGNAELLVDEDRLDSYIISFTVPFLAAAAVLYIIDTIIRKLRWQDIVSFFKRKKEAKK